MLANRYIETTFLRVADIVRATLVESRQTFKDRAVKPTQARGRLDFWALSEQADTGLTSAAEALAGGSGPNGAPMKRHIDLSQAGLDNDRSSTRT